MANKTAAELASESGQAEVAGVQLRVQNGLKYSKQYTLDYIGHISGRRQRNGTTKNEEMCSWHAAAEEMNIDIVKLLERGAYITMQETRVLSIEQRPRGMSQSYT